MGAAQKAAASEAINAADAASVAGFSSAMEEVEASLKAAAEAAEKKFGDLTVTMADQRADLDNKLGAAVDNINDSIAKQAALADSRFSKSVRARGKLHAILDENKKAAHEEVEQL